MKKKKKLSWQGGLHDFPPSHFFTLLFFLFLFDCSRTGVVNVARWQKATMEERGLLNSTETKKLLHRCAKIRAQLKGINCHWLEVCAGDRLYIGRMLRLSARPHARKECVCTFLLTAYSIKRCLAVRGESSWPNGLALPKPVIVSRKHARKPGSIPVSDASFFFFFFFKFFFFFLNQKKNNYFLPLFLSSLI